MSIFPEFIEVDIYYKSGHILCYTFSISLYFILRRFFMSRFKRYDDNFKKNLVSLYQNGKSISSLAREYGVSLSAISHWVKLYSEVTIDNGEVLTALQVKKLQKRNAQLEEENLILKKAIAIFTPLSNKD